MIKARMRTAGAWRDTCILNVSSRGMLLRSSEAPGRGSYLEIRRGDHIIVARVVWTAPGRFGVQTQDPVSVDSLGQASGRSSCSTAGEPHPAERRSVGRVLQVAHDQSRSVGRLIEFGTFLMIGGLATMLVAGVAVEVLFEPLAQADAALASR